MRSAWWASSLVVALAIGGCGDKTTGGLDSGSPAADSGSALDADTSGDGAVSSDAGDDAGTGSDAGVGADAGAPRADASTSDTGSAAADGGGSSGMACADLLACCSSVGANLQQTCIDTASAGDDARCAQILNIAMSLGACVPGGTDAGPAVDSGPFDAGPIGPVCTEYLACCPELGGLASRCQQTAAMGDETACGRSLDLARRVGRCLGDGGTPGLDASLPDLGLPDPDASLPDLGLSEDAAPSTDAAPVDPDAGTDPDAGVAPDA